MIGIYLRVSTDHQNIDNQRGEVIRWLDGRSARFFEDVDTGTKINRKEFAKLRKAIADGEIDHVVVFKIDRLGRTMIEGLEIFAKWLDQGIQVTSITEGFDFHGTMGKMVAAMLFGFAEMELKNMKERQAVGIRRAQDEGKYLGRKRGATKVKGTGRAQRLRDKGLTWREVANAMGVSVATAQRYASAN